MNEADEYVGMNEKRTRRTKIIAWVTIASLFLVGGGTTLLILILG